MTGGSSAKTEPPPDGLTGRFRQAQESLAKHDLATGLIHVSELLAADPQDPAWLALLDRYRKHTHYEATLQSLRQDRLSPTTALQARELYLQGELNEAVQMLSLQPLATFLEEWAPDWLEPEGAVESLTPAVAEKFFCAALIRFPEPRFATVRQLAQCRRFALLSKRVALQNGRGHQPREGLFRKARMLDEALALAEAGGEPDWHSLVALGAVEQERGRFEAAEAAFEKAWELDRVDVSPLLEIADMHFDGERWSDAARYYERVLKIEPEHDAAEPALAWSRWRERHPV